MLLSKEYVGYLAREVTKKLIAGEFIETKNVPAVTEKVHVSMLEELSLEDRINDEVRVILEAYSEEMQRTGANYQEMFRKVKSELTRKYEAVVGESAGTRSTRWRTWSRMRWLKSKRWILSKIETRFAWKYARFS